MTAFGGSGPMHGARIARKLHVPRVILPLAAGVISALGLLISPLSFEVVRSRRRGLESLTDDMFDGEFQPLIEEVSALLERSGVEKTSITLTRKLDMRYEGQGYEIEVPVPQSGRVKDIPNAFEAAYKTLFSSITLEERTEIVNWKVEGRGPQPSEGIRYRFKDVQTEGDALKGHRKAYFPEAGGYVDCPVYDRYRMRPGTRVKGPALVEERESTCVIGVDDSFEIDTHYNIIVDVQVAEDGS